MSNDEWVNEDFFMVLLLVAGGDPEPDTPKGSDEFEEWIEETQRTIRSFGVAEELKRGVWDAYWEWLQTKGLAWKGIGVEDE